MFKKATKEKIKVRLALSGASGAGKTYSALAISRSEALRGLPKAGAARSPLI